MTHHQIVLRTAFDCHLAEIDFGPAKWVKKLAKFPLDYRKRLSELQRKDLVIRDGKDGRFAIFSLTKKGLKLFKNYATYKSKL